ncbi:MAG: DUF4931 domain-containing protein [Bacillota bacterium]|nr:DUF4931 domain-containing protein [Bacillota bacterium]
MKNRFLLFNTSIGVKKPESIKNKQQACPFCDREQLTGILAEEGSIMLLKNKFPVLENAFQTVLIETDECEEEFSDYKEEHVHTLLQFGIKHWLDMERSGEYESVIFFKNHGPLSGGTIAHPHMQIIGLNDIDYTENIDEEIFQGFMLAEINGVEFTLSTSPRIGFYELNVQMSHYTYKEEFGRFVQVAVHYLLNHFPFKCSSYNIFFHHINQKVYAKIVPRFVTTPLYIGYSIPQIPNNLEWMSRQIRSIYFKEGTDLLTQEQNKE